jgi:CRISPR/Cas system CSM-associated protein Csm3 (group 7 of RAMP superfamily)
MAKANQDNHQVVGKIVIFSKIKNTSPLLIGRGTGASVDIELMKLPDGKVYIPGSSIAGCIKSFMLRHDLTSEGSYLWGRTSSRPSKDNDMLQSHIIVADMVPNGQTAKHIKARDGVKIAYNTGTAEDNMKYDYEILEPGVEFPFYAEITIRRGGFLEKDKQFEDARQFAADLKKVFEDDSFRIGAFTNTGFGKIECIEYKAYNFSFPQDAIAWFDYLKDGAHAISVENMQLEHAREIMKTGHFSVKGTFRLKTSLIIGSYGINGDEPDKIQLRCGEHFALPGKSIRGALRHRANKILSVMMSQEESNVKIRELFGDVDEANKVQIKSRFRVEEAVMKKEEVKPMLQNRVRIDRFTGGTIDAALFNSQPVWTTEKEKVSITLTIQEGASKLEKKLLLLLLKDLWLEDLPIGGEKNVGRGTLIGESAVVHDEGRCVATINRDSDGGIQFNEVDAKSVIEQIIQV